MFDCRTTSQPTHPAGAAATIARTYAPIMHPGLGQHDEHTLLLVTREIRWFHSGVLPETVATWFTTIDGEHHREQRTDYYDIDAAARGAGVKYRDATHVDSKFLLSRRRDLVLPPSLHGVVEDWVKISTPIAGEIPPASSAFLAVDKDIRTVTYALPDDDGGCEVELVAIRAGDLNAWSLCFETYGHPDLRGDAFRMGIERFPANTAPADITVTSSENHGYPAWIASLSLAG